MKETHARLHSNDKLKPKMDFFEPHYFFNDYPHVVRLYVLDLKSVL